MRIAAFLLAAGAAERFGGSSKLLAGLGDVPLIAHAARAIAGSAVSHIFVVTGRDAQSVAAAIMAGSDPEHARRFQFIHNPAWADGMGGSIAAGVRALPAGVPGDVPGDVDAMLIIPGDMPFLTPAILSAMIERFESAPEPRPIVFAQSPDGTQTNPVLWPKRFFAKFAGLSGAAGGKSLLQSHAGETMPLPVADGELLADIDTPDDLVRAAALLAARA